jgi:hypothetical protein
MKYILQNLTEQKTMITSKLKFKEMVIYSNYFPLRNLFE